MKVIVSSTGNSIDSPISPVFGRAKYYVMVDTDDLSCEGFENPAVSQSSGAGIQAAQFVLKKGPEAILSSNIGPNAFQVLSAGSIPCYSASEGTVREVVSAFNDGKLSPMGNASVDSHTGISGSAGTASSSPDEEDLEALTARLRDLRGQVAEILQQLDRLTEGR